MAGSRIVLFFLIVLVLPKGGWGQTVIFDDLSGASYFATDYVTEDIYGPIDLDGCNSFNFSFDYEWTLAWDGPGNNDTPSECSFSTPCIGNPDSHDDGGCFNCWDFLRAVFYVDGVVVYERLIGDDSTTDAEQVGTVTMPDFICVENASSIELRIYTLTWGSIEGEEVSFSNIEFLCYEAEPVIDANNTEFCQGDNLELDVIDTGSNNYEWDGPAGTENDAYWEINNLTESDAGTYTLTVTDDADCSVTDEIEIVVYPTPIADLELTGPAEICVGNCSEIRIASFDTSYDLYYNLDYGGESHGAAFSGSDNYITVCLDGSGSVSEFDEPSNTIHIPISEAGNSLTFTLDGINLEVDPLYCDGDIGNDEVTIDLVSGITAGTPTPQSLCDEGGRMATFDLTSANDEVRNGMSGTVTWYGDMSGTIVISDADAFMTGDTTVYAVLDDDNCGSPPVPMDLSITASEGGNIEIISLQGDTICGDGSAQDIQVRFNTPNASISYDIEYTYIKDGVSSNQSLTIINGVSNPSPTIQDVSSSLSVEITAISISGSCDFMGTSDILNVNVLSSPTITPISDTSSCDYFILPPVIGSNLTANSSYYFESMGAGSPYLPGDTIFSDTTLYAYDQAMMCSDEEEFTITVNEKAVINPVLDQIGCDSILLPAISGNDLTSEVGYFTLSGAKGNRYLPGDYISDSITLYVSDTMATCPPDEVEVNVFVPQSPDLSLVNSLDTCQQFILDSLSLNVDSLLWRDTLSFDSLYVGDTIFSSGVYQLITYQDGCESDTIVDYVIRPIASIDPIADISACDYYILPAISGNNLSGQQAFYLEKNGAGLQFLPGDTVFTEGWLFPYDTMNFCLMEPDSFFVAIEEPVDLSSFSGETACDFIVLSDLGLIVDDIYYTDMTGLDTLRVGDTIFTNRDLMLVTEQNTCKQETNYEIVVNSSPDIDDYTDVTSCDFYMLPAIIGRNLSGNEAYFDAFDGSGQQYQNGDTLYNSGWIYTLDPGGNCPSLVDSFYVDIVSAPDLSLVSDVNTCDFWVVEDYGVIADDIFVISIPGLDTFYMNDTIFNAGLYGFYAEMGTCQADQSFNIEFDASLSAGQGGEFDVCVDSNATLSLQDFLAGNYATGGEWASSSEDSEIDLQNNGLLRILQPGDYTFQYKVNSTNCGSDSTEVILHAGSLSNAGLDLDTFLCVPRDVLLSEYVRDGNAGGSFYLQDGTPLNDDPIFLAETEELSVWYIDDSGTCGPDTANISIKNTSFETIWWATNRNTLCPNECVDVTFYLESDNTFTFYFGLLDELGNQLTDTIILTGNDSITYNMCNIADGEFSWGNVEPGRTYSFGMVDIFTNEYGCQFDVLDIDFAFSTGSSRVGMFESSICRGDTIIIAGEAFHENRPDGEVFLPGGSVMGCDSIVMVSLQFEENVMTDIVDVLCEGDTLWVGEKAYHENNLQGTEIFNIGNCDSIVNVSLTLLRESYGEYSRIFCSDAGFYEVGSERFDINHPSGQAVIIGGNRVGCDSIVEVLLVYETAVMDTIAINNCDLDFQVEVNGRIYDSSNPSGIETLFGQAANGCDSIIVIDLTFEELFVDFESRNIICDEDTNIYIIVNETNAILPLKVSNGNKAWVIDQVPYIFAIASTNNQVFHYIDENNCEATLMLSEINNEEETINITYDDLGGGQFSLQTATNATVDSISWMPIDGLSCTDCLDPTVEIEGTVNYMLTLWTELGCVLTDSITLTFTKEDLSTLIIPNIFSPNEDGINDFWFPHSTFNQNLNINYTYIFDRWGNKVFQAGNYTTNQQDYSWNGKYNDQELNPGVYVYVLEYEDATGNIRQVSGGITLIR